MQARSAECTSIVEPLHCEQTHHSVPLRLLVDFLVPAWLRLPLFALLVRLRLFFAVLRHSFELLLLLCEQPQLPLPVSVAPRLSFALLVPPAISCHCGWNLIACL